MTNVEDGDFWHPRRCLRNPIPEIFDAAALLDRAVNEHLFGHHAAAAELIRKADMPAIRNWTESLWGSRAANPDQWKFHRFREIADAPPYLPKVKRVKARKPAASERQLILARYGRNCVFCGIPLIREEVRSSIKHVYSDALSWGKTNSTQHAAFQCMWLQFDHVVPHSRGGNSSLVNVVVTCAPCNYGRMQWTLDEVGLIDPRKVHIHKKPWDGLERFLSSGRPGKSERLSG